MVYKYTHCIHIYIYIYTHTHRQRSGSNRLIPNAFGDNKKKNESLNENTNKLVWCLDSIIEYKPPQSIHTR